MGHEIEIKNVLMEDLLPFIQELLQDGREVKISPHGKSMRPFIIDSRDSVVLVRPLATLKKLDMILYRRENGAFVLHRIVEVTDKGYTLCGDGQMTKEYGIKPSQVIAQVRFICKKNRQIDCRTDKHFLFFSRVWCLLFPVRKYLLFLFSLWDRRNRWFLRHDPGEKQGRSRETKEEPSRRQYAMMPSCEKERRRNDRNNPEIS